MLRRFVAKRADKRAAANLARAERRAAANLVQRQVRVAEQHARETLHFVLQNYGGQDVIMEYYIAKKPQFVRTLKLYLDSGGNARFIVGIRHVSQTRPLPIDHPYHYVLPEAKVTMLEILKSVATIEKDFSRMYYPVILMAVKTKMPRRSYMVENPNTHRSGKYAVAHSNAA